MFNDNSETIAVIYIVTYKSIHWKISGDEHSQTIKFG